MYHCYVDGTFAALNSEKECKDFFILLNSLHPSLHFTFEKEYNCSLLFLDVLVAKSKAEFSFFGLQESDIHRSVFIMEIFLFIQAAN